LDGDDSIVYLKKRWFFCAVILLCLVVYALLSLLGYFYNRGSVSAAAALSQADNYKVRSRLLMEAITQVGACDPTDATVIWASGLQKRSAALQYAVMDAQLKAEYAKQLEINAPNWVTGVSSPWVESYAITKTESPGEDSRIIQLIFSTVTSTGPAGDYTATLVLARDGCFWRITQITADDGLYPYTLFNP
jgi:hypothetical protein